MTIVYDIKNDSHTNFEALYNDNADYAAADKIAHSGHDVNACFDGCFTNDGIKDIFFIKTEDKNYIAACSRNYVYGGIDHWTIDKLITVDKNEGNQIYAEIKRSKFISKAGKTFYKTDKF